MIVRISDTLSEAILKIETKEGHIEVTTAYRVISIWINHTENSIGSAPDWTFKDSLANFHLYLTGYGVDFEKLEGYCEVEKVSTKLIRQQERKNEHL